MSSKRVQGPGGHSRGILGALVLLARRNSQVLYPPPFLMDRSPLAIVVVICP